MKRLLFSLRQQDSQKNPKIETGNFRFWVKFRVFREICDSYYSVKSKCLKIHNISNIEYIACIWEITKNVFFQQNYHVFVGFIE